METETHEVLGAAASLLSHCQGLLASAMRRLVGDAYLRTIRVEAQLLHSATRHGKAYLEISNEIGPCG